VSADDESPPALLAGLLAAGGNEVTWRGAAARGELPSLRRVGTWNLPVAVDLLISVHGGRAPDIDAARSIAWSQDATWPTRDEWDAVAAFSPHHAGLLGEHLPRERIEILPAGAQPLPAAKIPRDRLLYASSPERGLHRLLAIWPQLWQRFRIHLAIACDVRAALQARSGAPGAAGERLRAIEGLLEQPGVLPQGSVTAPAARRLLNRSLALLAPLEPLSPADPLHAPEILQACAAGVPPILAPVGSLREEYGESACFVGSGSADYTAQAWVEALEQVLVQREQREEAARAFAANRTWEACADRWMAFMERCLASPPKRESELEPQTWLVLAGSPADRGEVHPAAQLLAAAQAKGHELRVATDDPELAQQLAGAWAVERIPEGMPVAALLASQPDRIVLVGAGSCAPFLKGLGEGHLSAPVAALELTRSALEKLPFKERIDLVVATTRPGGAELFVRLIEALRGRRREDERAPDYVELVP